MKDAELYAVCDIIPEKANKFAGENGITHIYYDYKEMLKDTAIDAVCICVPSGLHGEITKDAARAGKHIVCEKPIEITSEKIEDVISVVRSCNVKMQCIFQRRTMSAAIAVKKAIKDGKFGKIILADAYLKYYRSQQYYNSAGWRGTWELDGGGYGVIEGSTAIYPGFKTKFEIHGEKGIVIFDDEGIVVWDFISEDAPKKPEASESIGGASDPAAISSSGHFILIKDLVDAIHEDRETMISPEEARTAVGLICTIYKSAKENTDVRF